MFLAARTAIFHAVNIALYVVLYINDKVKIEMYFFHQNYCDVTLVFQI